MVFNSMEFCPKCGKMLMPDKGMIKCRCGYEKSLSNEDIELIIKFKNEDQLLTTYPKYNNEWKVLVRKDGTIIDKSGRSYYALYFDEKNNSGCTFEEGFYVTKDNAISFLEEKLEILGFTEREANEFIMYWLPILEKNEHNLVYFELTEERNAFNEIEISPKPDSLLRMAIHVKNHWTANKRKLLIKDLSQPCLFWVIC